MLFAQQSQDTTLAPPSADSSSQKIETLVIVRNINIVGNKKTRRFYILRELFFKPTEQMTIGELVEKFISSRQQLLNTTLFVDVSITLEKTEGFFVDVMIDVRERWYLFPLPYLKPVDRNLNQWLFEKGGNLARVNYGIKVLHGNLSGYGDKLRLWFITGYTKQISVNYEGLYLDKKMNWGLLFNYAIGKNRELNYISEANKQVFFKDPNKAVQNFSSINLGVTYRKAIRTTHYVGISYSTDRIVDTIIKLNPNYFGNGRKSIKFPEFYYKITYYNLDYIPYPTKGYAAEFAFTKKGITKEVNSWAISAKATSNWHTGKKSFFNLTAYGSISVPFKQPYRFSRFLGYSDTFLQGYEYYVVEGVAGGFLKTSYTHQLFNFSIKTPGKNREIPERLPFKIYGKIFSNAGYVYNSASGNNSLPNRMLYSSGIGIDIFTSYDFTLKLEWTFNHLGQNNLFLHRKSIF